MDNILAAWGARRERQRERSELRTSIESLEAIEQREIEELERLQAEAETMKRRADDAKARREKAHADLLALHTVYGMDNERAALDEQLTVLLARHNATERNERKRLRE